MNDHQYTGDGHGDTDNTDLQLSMAAPGGIPLALAGYLTRAIGAAYPNATIDTAGRNPLLGSDYRSPALTFNIPRSDYTLDPDVSDWHLVEMAPDKEDPDLVAFTSGFKNGSLSIGPPPWLTALLLTAADSLESDVVGEANYMSMDLIPQNGGGPFTWIICRRGRPSPHELRQRAETRVAVLEEQLREAGIRPTRRKALRKKK